MHILDLNHDVFLTLLSFTDRKDALSLAYTSRDAFSLTIPRIMEDVTLQTAERIKRFASLASKQPSCLAWVRRLRITPGVFYQNSKFPNLTKDIANFLCFVNNLTALCLPKAEGLLVSNPDLANHIASFPSLRIIEFEGIGQKIALLLSSMNSRPHRLCIESPLRDSPGLSPLASVQIWEAGRADLPQLLKDTQWPSVIEATWRRSSVSIYSLAYAFPNITTLHLSANTYNFCHHPGVNSCFGENPWNNLHHISGFLDDLATNINLLFPIRRLTISEDTPIGDWEVRDALEIVRRFSPVVLSLALYPQLEFSTALTQVLPRIRCLRTVLPDTATIEQIMNWIVSFCI